MAAYVELYRTGGDICTRVDASRLAPGGAVREDLNVSAWPRLDPARMARTAEEIERYSLGPDRLADSIRTAERRPVSTFTGTADLAGSLPGRFDRAEAGITPFRAEIGSDARNASYEAGTTPVTFRLGGRIGFPPTPVVARQ